MGKDALKWFAGWVASHVADILLGGMLLAIVGFVIGFAGRMAEMIGLFPEPFAVACICSFALGVICHAAYDLVRESCTKRKNLADHLKDFKAEPCGEKKAAAAFIFKRPDHKIAVDRCGEAYLKDLERNYGRADRWSMFFEFDNRGDFSNVELVPWLVDLFKVYPEQLEIFTPEVKLEVEEELDR